MIVTTFTIGLCFLNEGIIPEKPIKKRLIQQEVLRQEAVTLCDPGRRYLHPW